MKSKEQTGFSAVEGVLILVAAGIIGFTGWYVWHARSNANANLNSAANTQVAVKGTPKKAAAKKPVTVTTPAVVISDSLKQNTSDSITSGNTAALQGYMADSVNVVIAGSEKSGAESSAAAVGDLDYLNSGTAPWNFALDNATLTAYQNGFYKQYFTAGSTIVGQAANGYVVSFGVNASGKIDTVFMSASTDQLQ